MNFTRSQSRNGGKKAQAEKKAAYVQQTAHMEKFTFDVVSVETREEYNKWSDKTLTFKYAKLSCGHEWGINGEETRRYCPTCAQAEYTK